jgi:Domain of unknown function (DUF4872)
VLWERGWNLRELTGCEAKKRGGQVLAPSPRFSQITNKRVSQTRPSKRGDFCSRMIRDAVRPSEKACCMALAWQNTVDPLLGNLLETCLWPLHSHISIIAIFSQMMGLSCQSRLGRSSRYAFSNLINNSRFTKVGHEPFNGSPALCVKTLAYCGSEQQRTGSHRASSFLCPFSSVSESRKVRVSRLMLGFTGTGGGIFRYMYGRFLSEAAQITGDERLVKVGDEMRLIGDQWQEVAHTNSRPVIE